METILKLKDEEYPFDYVDHTRKTARGILMNEKGEIAFNKLSGYDIFGDRHYYETPGGGVDDGETEEAALHREIKEETGYECEIIKPIGIVDDYYNLIHRHNLNYYFLCKTSLFVGKKLEDYETTVIEKVVWMDIDTAIKEFEKMDNSPIARLVRNRELPILKKVKELI